MKYRDTFIYKEESKFYGINYYICEFICDRPEKEVYVVYTLGFFHNYMEIPYKNIGNIFDLAGFKKDILQENEKIKNNLKSYRELHEYLKKGSEQGFNMSKFLEIYFELKDTAEMFETRIEKLEARPDKDSPHIEKQINFVKRELRNVKRGIRKKYKRLHKLFLLYSEEDLRKLKNPSAKIYDGERKIKANKERIEKVEKEWYDIMKKR